MATDNKKILTAEQELKLRQPIDDYVGAIQQKINALRENGTDKVLDIQGELDNLKRDRIYTAQEKESIRAKLTAELEKAKAVESKNKDEIAKLIADAEGYLKGHFNKDYYQAVVESTNEEKALAQQKYQQAVAQLNQEHQATVSKLSDHLVNTRFIKEYSADRVVLDNGREVEISKNYRDHVRQHYISMLKGRRWE